MESISLLGGGLDGRYFVWNLQTGEKAAESPQFQQQLADVVVTPDGKTLICRLFHGLGRGQEWSGQSRIVGWDIVDGGVQPLIEDIPGEIVCLTISADGRWFAAGGSQGPSPLRHPGQLVLWDRYRQPISLGGHRGIVWCISFSPDGRILASGGHGRVIRLWDTLAGELTQQLRGHRGPIHSLAFSPDGRLLASGSDDKTVRVWNISD